MEKSERLAIAAERLSKGIVKVEQNSATSLYYRQDGLRLSISKGNSKLEGIPQFNLEPIASCRREGLPCGNKCYANNLVKRYPSTQRAWAMNLVILRDDLSFVMSCISDFLTTRAPKFFRFHTSGDFDCSQDYVNAAIALAEQFPNVKFMCYTKIHELDFTARPANMTVVLSQWPGWDTSDVCTKQFSGQTFVQDGTETRIPAGTHQCPGSCAHCRACWMIAKKPNCAVYFDIH